MIILIELHNPDKNTVTVKYVQEEKRLDDYEAICLTAGNFTANPAHFNYLPPGLFKQKGAVESYRFFVEQVNKKKGTGILGKFGNSTYLLVPKKKGGQQVSEITKDLFAACKAIQVKELLITSWTYLNSRYPQEEIKSFVQFISENKKEITLDKIYIQVGRFSDRLYKDLEILTLPD